MKNTLYTITFCLSLILTFSFCADDSGGKTVIKTTTKSSKEKSNKNLNISFLLDLSDRINPEKYPNEAMEYYLRDVAYVKSVSEAFESHLKKKKVRQMNDRIQLFFDPEPHNQNINSISNDLKFNIGRDNVSLDMLSELKNMYSTKPLEIYELAIKDDEYIGSDTWRFFKSKVNDYCIEEDYRNILVVLTDGYIYHKNTFMKESNLTTYLRPQDIRAFNLDDKDWKDKLQNKGYGFVPANEDLSNLEILVLGINPDKKYTYEQDVIMRYWKDWFNGMNVKRYEIVTAELPSNLDKIIKDFILNE